MAGRVRFTKSHSVPKAARRAAARYHPDDEFQSRSVPSRRGTWLKTEPGTGPWVVVIFSIETTFDGVQQSIDPEAGRSVRDDPPDWWRHRWSRS